MNEGQKYTIIDLYLVSKKSLNKYTNITHPLMVYVCPSGEIEPQLSVDRKISGEYLPDCLRDKKPDLSHILSILDTNEVYSRLVALLRSKGLEVVERGKIDGGVFHFATAKENYDVVKKAVNFELNFLNFLQTNIQ